MGRNFVRLVGDVAPGRTSSGLALSLSREVMAGCFARLDRALTRRLRRSDIYWSFRRLGEESETPDSRLKVLTSFDSWTLHRGCHRLSCASPFSPPALRARGKEDIRTANLVPFSLLVAASLSWVAHTAHVALIRSPPIRPWLPISGANQGSVHTETSAQMLLRDEDSAQAC